MSVRYLVAAGMLVAVSMACSDGASGARAGEPPPADAGVNVIDAGADGDADAECPSCAWFPAACSPGALCPANAPLEPKETLLTIGAHRGSVVAAGTHGTVLDLVGGAWSDASVGRNDALRSLASRGDELWVAGSLDALFIRSPGDAGGAWTRHSLREGGGYFGHNVPVNGIFVDPERPLAIAAVTPVCAGGFFGDGVALLRLRRGAGAFTGETLIRHDGLMSKCVGLNAIDGSSDTIWTVGDHGAVYEVTDLDAPSPRIVAHNSGMTVSLLSVWVDPTGNVWAAGKDGALVHRAPGQPFVRVTVATAAALRAVRGTSASDVWAVGDDATALHFDGKSWSRVPIAELGDRRPTLNAIAALDHDRVWVAGDGVLLALAGADGGAP